MNKIFFSLALVTTSLLILSRSLQNLTTNYSSVLSREEVFRLIFKLALMALLFTTLNSMLIGVKLNSYSYLQIYKIIYRLGKKGEGDYAAQTRGRRGLYAALSRLQ